MSFGFFSKVKRSINADVAKLFPEPRPPVIKIINLSLSWYNG